MYDYALADAAHITNNAADRAAAEMIDAWRDFDRPPTARYALDIGNPRTNDAQNAATHCFDFRQLGHS